ncbi:MAG: hypothetical protein ACYSU7_09535 [Planctomycetota bacterium]
MNTRTWTLMAMTAGALGLAAIGGPPSDDGSTGQPTDARRLYELVHGARKDVVAIRRRVGWAQVYGNVEDDDDEVTGRWLRPGDAWDAVRNGAHLILKYDRSAQEFLGTVTNVTNKTLDDVRVEVHLSSGVELGPTRRRSLRPGQSIYVKLPAAGQRVEWWTTHPEIGAGEHGHQIGEDRREPGEHVERGEHVEPDEHIERGGEGASTPGHSEVNVADEAVLRLIEREATLLRRDLRLLAREIDLRLGGDGSGDARRAYGDRGEHDG